VLVVRAAPAGGRRALSATLVVERVLFGAPSPRTMQVQFNPLSGDSYTNGQRYVVFVDAQGTVEGGCSSVALVRPEARNTVDSLRDWFAARTDSDRVAVLVRRIAESPSKTASDAASFLAASPALLAAVDASARATLVAAIPAAHDERAYGLAWALGRLHAIDSLPAWIAWLGVAHNGANHRPVHDALELMTNHHDPSYTRGQDIHGEQLQRIQQSWAQWERANRGQPAAAFIANGFRERRVTLRSSSDRAQLAAALRAIPRDSTDELSRQVLTNACEMITRPAQSAMAHSFSAVDVTRALAACTTP
jgi:hypothetical protein